MKVLVTGGAGYVSNKIFTALLRLMFGVRLTDALFFHALGKKEVFEALGLESTDFSIRVDVPIKVHERGYNYAEIPSTVRRRIAGGIQGQRGMGRPAHPGRHGEVQAQGILRPKARPMGNNLLNIFQ